MKIFFNSVGCRLNQSEIERFANQFRALGHEVVGSPEESDLVVINTCTVTSPAAADSRAMVRRAHRKNPTAKTILTGCWSTLEREKALELPGVVRVVENEKKDRLVPIILGLPEVSPEIEPRIRLPVAGVRKRTRAFIKVQDGCDNRCSFCITTIARGPARSLPQKRILSEIQSAVAGGIQEAVLTGVQLTAYGSDLPGNLNLKVLVQSILRYTDIPRLRLSSLEPWQIHADFFELWGNNRLCRQLHLPLQSGSDEVLRRMGRPITSHRYASIVAQARESIPSVAITSDIIVGFPGETEHEFEETLQFVQEMRFAHAHVFTYSTRPGTSAALLPNRIPSKVARHRSKQLLGIQEQSSHDYRESFIGEELIALWETASQKKKNEWEMRGITDNYLRVRTIGNQNMWNKLTAIHIIANENGDLISEIVP